MGRDFDAVAVRRALCRKLQFAVERVGSLAETCDLVGINRTQFSRYLSGKSMPRPDTLYRLARLLDLPLDWFFDTEPDIDASLAEYHLGVLTRKFAAGRRISPGREMLPEGYYAKWKRPVMSQMPYDLAVCRTWYENGVCRVRLGGMWHRGERIGPVVHWRERKLDGVVQRCSNGIFVYIPIGPENRVYSIFLRETPNEWDSTYSTAFSGIAISGMFGTVVGRAVVPVLMTHHGELGFGALRDLMRRAGSYEEDEVPVGVRRHFEAFDRLEPAKML